MVDECDVAGGTSLVIAPGSPVVFLVFWDDDDYADDNDECALSVSSTTWERRRLMKDGILLQPQAPTVTIRTKQTPSSRLTQPSPDGADFRHVCFAPKIPG